ncbi:RNase H family protein [Rhizobium oryzicola]|uniref:ribonuclease H n=1 Tax=Rhizobium oryzicola TaxID=1232668 RepID=A0ABT8T2T8_9HYPH|nr:RNase H family protein [Rhizobium oryzicola]MDO1584967.1 ribonuclease HI [Rhizobium oryzicola]
MSGNIDVYIDGSFCPDTKLGGWAFVVYQDGAETESQSASAKASGNGEMELAALCEALQWLRQQTCGPQTTIWSDSHYVVEGCNRLLKIWRSNGWKRVTANSRERKRWIPDRHQWQVIDDDLNALSCVSIAWCKGHAEVEGNERADDLARRGALGGKT